MKADPEEALSYFQQAAEADVVAALNKLGHIYLSDKIVEADATKALGYYQPLC